MAKSKKQEAALHPHYGKVIVVREDVETETTVVRLESGVEQTVTTEWLTPVSIDDQSA